MSICNFSPTESRRLRWMYSYNDIIGFYKQKNKEYAEKHEAACKFVAEFTNSILSAMYGGKSSEETVGKDSGESLDEMDDAQILEWHEILSQEEFDEMFKDYDVSDLFPPIDKPEGD